MASRTLTTSAEELLPQNLLRKSFVVQNEDSAIAIFLRREQTAVPAVSSTVHDHRLGPSGAIALNFGTDGEKAIQDRWTVVAASGTPRVSFFETEDIRR